MAMNRNKARSKKCEKLSCVGFENRSPRSVTLLWHNYKGKLVRYAIIKPGGIYETGTYVTHPWSACDSETGDKLFIDKQFIFYPKEQEQDDDVARYDRVYIDLPVYPLWIRCLQILRKTTEQSEVDGLEIPRNLKEALKSVPNKKCSTYTNFLIIDNE